MLLKNILFSGRKPFVFKGQYLAKRYHPVQSFGIHTMISKTRLEKAVNQSLKPNTHFSKSFFNHILSRKYGTKEKEGDVNDSDEKKVDVKDEENHEGGNRKEKTSSSSSSESSEEEYEDPSTKAKYKNLLDLYGDQASKLEFTKTKFLELKSVFLNKKQEVENLKQRTEKEVTLAREYAITKFVKDVIDANDNFTRAFDSVKDIDFTSQNEEEKVRIYNDYAEGLLMTYNSFKNNVTKNGLQELRPLDQVYDPEKHIVVENYEDTTKKSNVVGKVAQIGYTYQGKILLRPAKVSVVRNVVKKPAATSTETKESSDTKSPEESAKSENKEESEGANNAENKNQSNESNTSQ